MNLFRILLKINKREIRRLLFMQVTVLFVDLNHKAGLVSELRFINWSDVLFNDNNSYNAGKLFHILYNRIIYSLRC